MLYNIIQSNLLKSNYKMENDNFESYSNLLLLLIDMEQKVYEFIYLFIYICNLSVQNTPWKYYWCDIALSYFYQYKRNWTLVILFLFF